MRLTLDERTDETVSQLRNLPVWTAEGDKIPLAAMADFRLAPGPERIEEKRPIEHHALPGISTIS